METAYYLDIFKKTGNQLDQHLLSQHQLELKVGEWLQSAVLKMQKLSWLNQSQTARPFEESIFFSIWVNKESISKNRLHYNIHALKLRELKNYSIQSREFAAAFRSQFKAFEKKWPNVSTDFGPLTLMQGWISLDSENFNKEVLALANNFIEIQFIIDDLLATGKKP
jgi:hypothetical protein